MVPAVLRSTAGFGVAHLVFGGHRILWPVLALVVGVVVGAPGIWLIRRDRAGPCRRCGIVGRRQSYAGDRPPTRPLRRKSSHTREFR